MSLKMTCPNPSCVRQYVIPESAAGRSTQCRACGQTFVIGDSGTNIGSAPPAPAGPRHPSASQPEFQTVGRFLVRGKLGAGAFGTVYRAYDPNLNREVALKIPNPGAMDSPQRVERFLREAKAAANLRHPHIVPVFDAGHDGDRYYIASAFIDGKPLSDTIEERGTDFPRAARVVRELAEALAYAHEQGIVHRDVKPQNIMVDAHGHIHLMDFGLAARHDEEARLTADGAVMGTPAYMAPEQAAGQKGEAQPATDQYAAGVVLYELLTGQVPFSGPLPVVMHNVIHTAPDSPRKFRAYLPKDLETICLKAMAKRPEDRYADCQELADDLRRWLEREPITARRMGFGERAARWVKKEPKLAIGTAIIVVVVMVSFVLISAFARRANTAWRQMEPTVEQAKKDASAAQAAENRAADALANAQAALAREEQATRTAAEDRKKAEALQATIDEQVKTITALQVQVQAQQAQLGAWLWDAKTTAEVLTLKGHSDSVYSASFSADGSRIVTGSFDNTAKVWDAKKGAEVLTLKGHTNSVYSASFSADGTLIMTGSKDNTARVWDAKNGRERSVLKGHTGFVTSVGFSSVGLQVVTGSTDKTVRVWMSEAEFLVLKGHTEEVRSAMFSPDGTRIVTGSDDKTARVWDAKTGAELRALRGHAGSVNSAMFSPDGTRIVTGSDDKTARVWDAKTGAEVLTLKGHTHWVHSASFSADGSRIVTGSSDDTARVWDAKPTPTEKSGKFDARKLIGKWQTTGAVVEFTKDGKSITIVSEIIAVNCTYKLEGDKLSFELKVAGETFKETTVTLTKLTDDEMVTEDKEGKVETFKRVKP